LATRWQPTNHFYHFYDVVKIIFIILTTILIQRNHFYHFYDDFITFFHFVANPQQNKKKTGGLQIRNLLHILVEFPWTIYLPLFLLLKMVMVKHTGVPCGISKGNLKHSTTNGSLIT